MTTYSKPDGAMLGALRESLATHHKRLKDAGVEVYLLAAYAPVDKYGQARGPALKLHGVPALAIAKVTSHKHRVAGLGDAEITLDGDKWASMSQQDRLALVDHELTHLELVFVDGLLARDDGKRPKLKIRPHDHQHGFFDEVARRHGAASQEVQQARRFSDEVGQFYFDEMTPTPTPTRSPRQRGGPRRRPGDRT